MGNALKIAVLSREASLYSTRRLIAAGEERGHLMAVVNPLRCYMDITARSPQLRYQGNVLPDFDAVIPRIGPSRTRYGTAVMRQFAQMGVYVANRAEAIVRSRDKLQCLQCLAQQEIDVPLTSCAHATQDIDQVIDLVGGPPVVIKVLEGSQGNGVILAESLTSARSIIQALRGLKVDILVQEFIEEAAGKDLRCLVVRGEVVAAMMRTGAPGEFRANVHRGGTVRPVQLTSREAQMAIAAAAAVGLDIAGVDMLRAGHGPVVIEINSSPGLEGIEAATEINVAGLIIDAVSQAVNK